NGPCCFATLPDLYLPASGRVDMLLPPSRRNPRVVMRPEGRFKDRGTLREIMMPLRYAFLAAALCVAGLAAASAQSAFPPVGQQQSSPFPPIGQESPFPSPNTTTVFGVPGQQPRAAQPQAQAQEMPPCLNEFIPLRQELEKRFEVVKNTMSKK